MLVDKVGKMGGKRLQVSMSSSASVYTGNSIFMFIYGIKFQLIMVN